VKIRVHSQLRKRGGSGIRTQGNGFANRGLSPLGEAAIINFTNIEIKIIPSKKILGKKFFKVCKFKTMNYE
jgi:hypothetical protein